MTLAHRKWVYEAEKGGSSEIGSCKISFRSQRFSEPDWGSREIILKSWRSILINFGRRNLRTISCLPGWSVHKLKIWFRKCSHCTIRGGRVEDISKLPSALAWNNFFLQLDIFKYILIKYTNLLNQKWHNKVNRIMVCSLLDTLCFD